MMTASMLPNELKIKTNAENQVHSIWWMAKWTFSVSTKDNSRISTHLIQKPKMPVRITMLFDRDFSSQTPGNPTKPGRPRIFQTLINHLTKF